ncbi:hypothetical protein [Cellulomonas soli]|uniref:Uncharacterized protein n=1 Tax=Cellulomonas soli TaxID=931535 RepID=A0A512PCP2_9CELL|nr:hypothetical protein [Cellulomonas soli]NYI58555.1 hypothetical protein [Cellulomonas soli]GEP68979.1 hypothetical protein CSO01_16940 [Cellulomonas soli]
MSGQPPAGGDGRRELSAFFGWSRPSPEWYRQTPVPWWKSLTQPRWSSGARQTEVPTVAPTLPVADGTVATSPAGPERWEPADATCVPTPFGAYDPGPYGAWAQLAAGSGGVRRSEAPVADRRFRVACVLLVVTTVLLGVGMVALSQVVDGLA